MAGGPSHFRRYYFLVLLEACVSVLPREADVAVFVQLLLSAGKGVVEFCLSALPIPILFFTGISSFHLLRNIEHTSISVFLQFALDLRPYAVFVGLYNPHPWPGCSCVWLALNSLTELHEEVGAALIPEHGLIDGCAVIASCRAKQLFRFFVEHLLYIRLVNHDLRAFVHSSLRPFQDLLRLPDLGLSKLLGPNVLDFLLGATEEHAHIASGVPEVVFVLCGSEPTEVPPVVSFVSAPLPLPEEVNLLHLLGQTLLDVLFLLPLFHPLLRVGRFVLVWIPLVSLNSFPVMQLVLNLFLLTLAVLLLLKLFEPSQLPQFAHEEQLLLAVKLHVLRASLKSYFP